MTPGYPAELYCILHYWNMSEDDLATCIFDAETCKDFERPVAASPRLSPTEGI
jgi:hypothetical protein